MRRRQALVAEPGGRMGAAGRPRRGPPGLPGADRQRPRHRHGRCTARTTCSGCRRSRRTCSRCATACGRRATRTSTSSTTCCSTSGSSRSVRPVPAYRHDAAMFLDAAGLGGERRDAGRRAPPARRRTGRCSPRSSPAWRVDVSRGWNCGPVHPGQAASNAGCVARPPRPVSASRSPTTEVDPTGCSPRRSRSTTARPDARSSQPLRDAADGGLGRQPRRPPDRARPPALAAVRRERLRAGVGRGDRGPRRRAGRTRTNSSSPTTRSTTSPRCGSCSHPARSWACS